MTATPQSVKLQRLALLNVCLGQFMTALDSRSIIVALPTISIHFNSSMAVVQWIPLAYQLTIIGFVLSLARLGDIRGRKKIYGSGFLLLALGSVCSGLSTGLWQIIAFRVLAGVGGAMVLGNGRAIPSIVYAQQERGRSLGVASMAFHLGYISGPSVAGVLIDTVGWRWIFFLNLPVALGGSLHGLEGSPGNPGSTPNLCPRSAGYAHIIRNGGGAYSGLTADCQVRSYLGPDRNVLNLRRVCRIAVPR
jgi:MFS family permease